MIFSFEISVIGFWNLFDICLPAVFLEGFLYFGIFNAPSALCPLPYALCLLHAPCTLYPVPYTIYPLSIINP